MPGDSIRDDLAASMAELQEDAGQGGTPPSPEDTSTYTPSDTGTDTPAQAAARARDAAGRFAPKTDSQDTLPQDKEPKTPTEAPAPGPLKAPVSWKPEERDGWEKMSPVQQQAVHRREREVEQALRESATQRQLAQEFQRVAAPYQAFFPPNTSSIQAAQSLFQTAAALRTSSPGERAGIIASIVQDYGVDLNLLDQALSARVHGTPYSPGPQDAIAKLLDQRLQPVTEFMQSLQQRNQQAQQEFVTTATSEWEQFAGANDYAWDVKDDMADLIEMAAKRGRVLSLQDAYKQATLAHPTISGLVQKRSQSTDPAQLSAAARRAREAGASISTGAPSQSGSADEGDGSLRSDLMASISQLSGQRR